MKSSDLKVGEVYYLKDWRYQPMTLKDVLPGGQAVVEFEQQCRTYDENMKGTVTGVEVSTLQVPTREKTVSMGSTMFGNLSKRWP